MTYILNQFNLKLIHHVTLFCNCYICCQHLTCILQRMIHLQFLITYIFSVSLKFGAYYITGQCGEFKVKNRAYCLHILFLHFCCCFSSKNLCFYHCHFFFLLNNQKPEFVIRNYQWNYRLCT